MAKERRTPAGCVLATGCVGFERARTGSRVEATPCVLRERIKPGGRVVGAGCKVEERISPLSRVVVGIASVGWRAHRPHCGREPEAGQRDETYRNCSSSLN